MYEAQGNRQGAPARLGVCYRTGGDWRISLAGGPADVSIPPAPTAAALLEEADGRGLRRLWLHSSLAGAVNLRHAPGWDAQLRAGRLHAWRLERRAGDRPAIDLFDVTECGRTRGLASAAPAELLGALALLEETFGRPYGPSPEATASRLLVSLHAGPRAKPLQAVHMPPPALEPRTEADWLWEAPRRPSGRVVVALDVNAAYLAAASSLRTGVGAVGHERAPDLTTLRPGYYFATITPPSGLRLPSPFPAGEAWVATPTLQLARDVGADVRVTEAWTWREHARPLEPWYRVLRDARAQLGEKRAGAYPPDEAARLALGVVKLMYGPLLGGRVASERWDRTDDPLFRPDWRHAVIATARANLFRHLLRLPVAWRRRLWAIATDALYFVTDRDGTLPPLPIDAQPGHLKVLWMRALDDIPTTTRGVLGTLRTLQA